MKCLFNSLNMVVLHRIIYNKKQLLSPNLKFQEVFFSGYKLKDVFFIRYFIFYTNLLFLKINIKMYIYVKIVTYPICKEGKNF